MIYVLGMNLFCLMICDELYCHKLVLLVMKHIVFAYHKPVYFLPILEAPGRGGNQNSQW
jgi:hypothetical protein